MSCHSNKCCDPCPPCETQFPTTCESLELTNDAVAFVVQDSANCKKILLGTEGQIPRIIDGLIEFTTATSNATPNTIVERDNTGGAEFAQVDATSVNTDDLYVANSIGVGTTTPAFKVHIVGEGVGAFTVDRYSPTGIGSGALLIRKANGTVGTPTPVLVNELIGRVAGFAYGSTGFGADPNILIDFRAAENINDTAKGSYITFNTTNNGQSVSSEKVRIQQDGKVGIGTVAPTAKLEISELSQTPNATWAGGADHLKLFAPFGSSFSEPAIKFQENGTDVGAVISGKNAANGAMAIIFANRDNTSTASPITEKMRISTAGRVGIGTGGAGLVAKLTVSDPSSASAEFSSIFQKSTSNISLNPLSSAGAWTPLASNNDKTIIYSDGVVDTGSLVIAQHSTSPRGIKIDVNGNVGIGTATPIQKLHVDEGAALITKSFYPVLELQQTGSTGVGQVAMSGDELEIRQVQNFAMSIYTNNTQRMRIDASGNVGIGIAVPSSKLHVDGDITVSSATTATAATAGAQTLPANPEGFLVVSINGTSRKIPYYAT